MEMEEKYLASGIRNSISRHLHVYGAGAAGTRSCKTTYLPKLIVLAHSSRPSEGPQRHWHSNKPFRYHLACKAKLLHEIVVIFCAVYGATNRAKTVGSLGRQARDGKDGFYASLFVGAKHEVRMKCTFRGGEVSFVVGWV